MVYSASAPLSGLTYTVTSHAAEPSAGELPSRPPGRPRPPSEQLPQLRRPVTSRSCWPWPDQITKGATTPFTKAVALQSWYFTAGNGFSYSLVCDVPNNTVGLVKFLTKTSAASASSSRSRWPCSRGWLGIPSRIAVGYTAGASEAGTAPGRSRRPTRTPGRSCTSPGRAGCGSSRRRAAPAARAPRSSRTTPPPPALPAPGGPQPGPQRDRQPAAAGPPPGGTPSCNHLATGKAAQGAARDRGGRRFPVRAARRGWCSGWPLIAPATARVTGPPQAAGAGRRTTPALAARRLARADRRPGRLRPGLPAERVAARRGPPDRAGLAAGRPARAGAASASPVPRNEHATPPCRAAAGTLRGRRQHACGRQWRRRRPGDALACPAAARLDARSRSRPANAAECWLDWIGRAAMRRRAWQQVRLADRTGCTARPVTGQAAG